MALCTTPACACAFTSSSLTITQVGNLVTLEQAGDSEITQLRDDLDALQSAYDAYIAANDSDVAALEASVAALLAAVPSASSTWVPTISGFVRGSGTELARYVRIGSMVFCTYTFVLGAGSSVSGDIQLSNPVNSNGVQFFEGTASLQDTSTIRYQAAVYYITVATIAIRPLNASATYGSISTTASATVPMTWTSGDIITASWFYQAA